MHVLPPRRQFRRHGLQSLGPHVIIGRVVIRLVVVRPVRVRFPRPLLHRKDVRVRVRLRSIIQPGRHVADGHVESARVAVTGWVDNGIRGRRERYLRRRSFAEELRVEVDAFAVDQPDVLGGIRRVAGVEVPADAEQVAGLELDLLASESTVDGFGDVALQTGHVTILPPDDGRFPDGSRFPTDRQIKNGTEYVCVHSDLRFGKCGGHEDKFARGCHNVGSANSFKGCNERVARG